MKKPKMQFTVERNNGLLRDLNLLQGVAAKKDAIPVLTHVLVEASKGNSVHLRATDLDVALECRIPARVQKAGALTLPAKKLYKYVRAMRGSEIRIEGDNDTASVYGERSRIDFTDCLSGNEFPVIAEPPSSWTPLEAGTLRELIRKTSFAVCDDITRYYLIAARLEMTSRRLRMVATDGHRLTCMSVKRTNGKSGVNVNIPKKALLGLAKILKGEQGAVDLAKSDNHFFFRVGGQLFIFKHNDEDQFPDYKKLLGEDRRNKKVLFKRKDLIDALDRVSVAVGHHLLKPSKVALDIAPRQMGVSMNRLDYEASESVDVVYKGRSQLEVAFECKYLVEFLKATNCPTICLSLNDDMGPALLKPNNGEDYRYVVMPMRR